MLITFFSSSTSLRYRWKSVWAGLQHLVGFASDPYRPELHYMRGPGPKWREKQDREQDLL